MERRTYKLVAERGGCMILSGCATGYCYSLAEASFRARWNLGADVRVRAIGIASA